MPDFVVGYAWHSIAPRLTALLARGPGHDARDLPARLPAGGGRAAASRPGDGGGGAEPRRRARWRPSPGSRCPLIRTAVLGGCVLVVLTVISEYGAFEILRYQTFTTEIFTEFQFDPQAAGALSIPLVLLGLLVLSVEGLVPAPRDRARPPVARPGAAGTIAADGAFRCCSALAALVGARGGRPDRHDRLLDAQSQHTTLPAAATLGAATLDHRALQRVRCRRRGRCSPCRSRCSRSGAPAPPADRARAQHLRDPGAARAS